jgi:hypothetical protein
LQNGILKFKDIKFWIQNFPSIFFYFYIKYYKYIPIIVRILFFVFICLNNIEIAYAIGPQEDNQPDLTDSGASGKGKGKADSPEPSGSQRKADSPEPSGKGKGKADSPEPSGSKRKADSPEPSGYKRGSFINQEFLKSRGISYHFDFESNDTEYLKKCLESLDDIMQRDVGYIAKFKAIAAADPNDRYFAPSTVRWFENSQYHHKILVKALNEQLDYLQANPNKRSKN